jgi:NRPS condensation-like uncharacterized protein
MYRPLGSGERALWLYDRVAPVHFALTARIAGDLQVDPLKQALLRVQQRHPLLRVCIVLDECGQPWFMEGVDSIPLRVVQRQGEQHWQQEVERELAKPFVWAKAPLLRVVLLHSNDVSELIATCHHSIADGLSAAYLLRDIVQALCSRDRSQQLLPERPSFEDMIPGMASITQGNSIHQNLHPVREMAREPKISKDEAKGAIDNSDQNSNQNYRPRLISWSLSSEKTASLISCCRQEQTSVHAAISAAFLLAMAKEIDRNCPTLKCLSPINIRRYLSPAIAEDFGYYISSGLTSHVLTPDLSLWDLARSLKDQLNGQMSPEKIFEGVPRRQAFMSTNPSPSMMQEVFNQSYSYDLLVTNLGRLNVTQQFGKLELQAIYGPAVMTRIQSDRVLGVTTLGDQLFFTLTYSESELSPARMEQLQQEAMQQLRAGLV